MEAKNPPQQPVPDLKKFVNLEMIRHNYYEGVIALWGHFGDESKNAVVILRTELPKVPPSLKEFTELKETLSNDAYFYLTGSLMSQYKIDVVYPATYKKHYHKYRDKIMSLKRETPQLYQIKKEEKLKTELQHLTWVTDILEGRKEADRVLYKDDHPKQGFVLLKDSSWDDEDPSKLHVLAIARDKELYSLRDLRQQHIPILKAMQEAARKVITSKYKLNSYREFLHYPPTFWHLHVHFLSLQLGGRSTMIQRCHQLNQVMYNLQLSSNYYRDATITVLRENFQAEQ